MPSPATPAPTSRARAARPRWQWVGAIILVLAVAYAIWQFPTWQRLAATGSAYGARMGCSCRYIEGRSLASCATDFEPGMEQVSLAAIDGEQGVRASVPLLASRTAHFHPATGCVLDE